MEHVDFPSRVYSSRVKVATLVSFIVSKEHANGVDNRQARMLAGALLEPHTPEPRAVATDLFPLAQVALATRVDFAFVTEHFDLGLLLLARRLGVPLPNSCARASEFLPQQPLPIEINSPSAALWKGGHRRSAPQARHRGQWHGRGT